MEQSRKIIHVDMDAFYASVEQLDNPELKGKPVIVGGRPDSRGVVAACSYEARKFGIRSAMPCARASSLCPEAIFLSPRMSRYRELSDLIMKIFRQYTDIVEPLSLDEAFLDITVNKSNQLSATILAREICQKIFHETGLTASAGVSCNKFVAKIASDLNKPNGISVIKPEQILDFLASLPIGKFFGVGKVTEKKMISLGIRNGADLRGWSLENLVHHFGKQGSFYFNIVRGKDNRDVQSERTRKSLGAERTLKEDTRDIEQIEVIIAGLVERIGTVLANKQWAAQTVTLKVRYSDFTTITRSLTPREPLVSSADIQQYVDNLIARTEAGQRLVRLLGISLSNLFPARHKRPRQLVLPFTKPSPGKQNKHD
jgi:DNA polymerase-4